MSTPASIIDLSIIIPAYNEALRIRPTLDRVHAFLSRLAGGVTHYEILVVDDGSADGTADVVDDIARAMPNLRVIRSRPNRGKGRRCAPGCWRRAGVYGS